MKSRRIPVSATLAILVAVTGGFFVWQLIGSPGGGPGTAKHSLRSLGPGWTKLPSPPKVRDGMSVLWAGSELLVWGGCEHGRHHCVRVGHGSAFDPSTRTWRQIADAPIPGAYAKSTWTGTEAIVFPQRDQGHLAGEAYNPERERWRRIPTAPIAAGDRGVVVWTGSEVIIWGGGGRGNGRPTEGAAYNPEQDAWRRIANAPIGLNLASGMWTGKEMLVFGSLLHAGNHAVTPTSVGAAYNPMSDKWRRLPASSLSAQATSAVWVQRRMVAWDYGVRSQEYLPRTNSWTKPIKMPLDFDECYPDSVAIAQRVFAFFCGYAALYDPARHAWRKIHGGPLAATVHSAAYHRSIKLWRFADLTPATDTVFFLGEGLTLGPRGEACYGCPGSPHSFWAYRPGRRQ